MRFTYGQKVRFVAPYSSVAIFNCLGIAEARTVDIDYDCHGYVQYTVKDAVGVVYKVDDDHIFHLGEENDKQKRIFAMV